MKGREVGGIRGEEEEETSTILEPLTLSIRRGLQLAVSNGVRRGESDSVNTRREQPTQQMLLGWWERCAVPQTSHLACV